MEAESPWTDNIEVVSSHIGLGFNAAVYYILANRLAQRADGWEKFNQDDWLHRMMQTNSPV